MRGTLGAVAFRGSDMSGGRNIRLGFPEKAAVHGAVPTGPCSVG